MVRDLKIDPPGHAPVGISTFANRQYVALRATLPRLVHDMINPLFILRNQVSVAAEEIADSKGCPDRHVAALQNIEKILIDMDEMTERAMREVNVMKAIFKQETDREPHKGVPITSVMMAAVVSIDNTRKLIQVEPKSQRRAMARVGELELVFASLILHVFDLARPTQEQPLLVTAHDVDAESLTRIAISAQKRIHGEQNNADCRSRLSEYVHTVEARGGSVDLQVANGLSFTLPYIDG